MNKKLNKAAARYFRPFLVVLMMLILMFFVSPTSADDGTLGWTPAGDMHEARAYHTATLLSDGFVLVAGGRQSFGDIYLNRAELYNPATNTWTTTGSMNAPRAGHTATLMPNGLVLVAGGTYKPFDHNNPGSELNSAELYDPATGTWAFTGNMNDARSGHTATLLQDGRVLVTGGFDNEKRIETFDVTLDSTEIFDPATGTWSPAADMTIPRRDHTATRLLDGQVLVAGGDSNWIATRSTELYNPEADTWIPAGDMTTGGGTTGGAGRFGHTATLLEGGQVLIAGGWDGYDYGYTKGAELYDPLPKTWTATDYLDYVRFDHTATLLQDGRVLVAGGEVYSYILKTAEIFDPVDEFWSLVPDMSVGRYGHTATLLQDGRVLITGGESEDDGGATNKSELFGAICAELPGNIIRNPCFEDGKSPWSFYTNGWAGFNVSGPAYGGSYAAKVEIDKEGSNVQLYQASLPLEPNQQYMLYFAAKSNSGHDVSLYVHKHGYPYSNYGLYNEVVDLTPQWQQFTIDFTTNYKADDDGRLRFWLAPYDAAGDEYWFDNVYLLKVTDGVPPPPDPNPPEPPVPPPGHCSPPVAGNVIGNPGFEASSISPWAFYTDGSAGRLLSSDRYECSQAFEAAIYKEGSNVQLYQASLDLQPNTPYQLRLAAKATDGRDVRLYLHKHGSPYTNYGLNGLTLDLTDQWQVFVVQFTTTGFSTPVTDGRLRIWLAETDAPGAHYFVDDVVLIPLTYSTSASLTAVESPDTTQRVMSTGHKVTTNSGTSTGQVLSSGFFIDDDDAGRARGGFIPGSQRGGSRCESAQPSHASLWPANGQLVKVKIVGAGKPQKLTISGIWQDEDAGAQADGFIDGQAAWLRAERDEGGNGRVYHVAFSATYHGGGTCEHEVLVTVPTAKGANSIDDGPLADSTRP